MSKSRSLRQSQYWDKGMSLHAQVAPAATRLNPKLFANATWAIARIAGHRAARREARVDRVLPTLCLLIGSASQASGPAGGMLTSRVPEIPIKAGHDREPFANERDGKMFVRSMLATTRIGMRDPDRGQPKDLGKDVVRE
jgi:hypothetical protein